MSVGKNADLEYWDEYKILRVAYGVSSYIKIACARPVCSPPGRSQIDSFDNQGSIYCL